ncbi:MAG: hypothetical protein OXC80_11015 [Gammaproteobacteria bacterium]|nr:hypothetical protein [Gammaproteobacteria bacterium]
MPDTYSTYCTAPILPHSTGQWVEIYIDKTDCAWNRGLSHRLLQRKGSIETGLAEMPDCARLDRRKANHIAVVCDASIECDEDMLTQTNDCGKDLH